MKWTWTGSAFSTNESAWSAMVTGSQSRVWSGPEASDGTHWARVSNLHVKLRTYLLAIVASIIHLLDCPSAVGNASPCMMIADLTVPMCNRGPPPPFPFSLLQCQHGWGCILLSYRLKSVSKSFMKSHGKSRTTLHGCSYGYRPCMLVDS